MPINLREDNVRVSDGFLRSMYGALRPTSKAAMLFRLEKPLAFDDGYPPTTGILGVVEEVGEENSFQIALFPLRESGGFADANYPGMLYSLYLSKDGAVREISEYELRPRASRTDLLSSCRLFPSEDEELLRAAADHIDTAQMVIEQGTPLTASHSHAVLLERTEGIVQKLR